MHFQKTNKERPLVLAGHNDVHKAFIQLELRSLESIRQGLLHGSLDDARTGKTDERARFGYGNIPEHGKTGSNPAGSGIAENKKEG